MFAIEHFGIVPDIMALAKGIASGMPLGALVARANIMNWEAGSHASTFGGNPLSCQAAMTTIELLEENSWQTLQPREIISWRNYGNCKNLMNVWVMFEVKG
jgi:4-aminobutyrate aminotransferase-like enzyme